MNSVLAFCAAAWAAQAAAQEKPPGPPPEPAFQSFVKQVTVGGQARLRAEYRDFLAYVNDAPSREDDDVYLLRLRINFTFTVTDDLEVFIQPQDQRTFGDEASVLGDETNLDLHQGFVEFKSLGGEPLSVKAGRQELSYGDQRLVSPLDWSNVARAWDGVKVRYAPDGFRVEGFYTVVKEGTGAEDDQDFYGLYASYVGVAGHEFDLYAFGRELNNNAFASETAPAPVNDRRDWTAGARLKGNAGGFDYTAEGMLQRGDLGPDEVEAWAAAFTLGVTLDVDGKPRVGVEVTHASGDDDPADGDIETFDPPFPFGHAYQGFADVFSFRNGSDFAVTLKVAPADTLTLHVDVHAFWLDEERDAWYNFAGNPIRRDPTGAADDRVGSEIDVHARVAAGRHVKFWGGWSRFFAGPYVRDTPGTRRDMDWFFLQMTVDF